MNTIRKTSMGLYLGLALLCLTLASACTTTSAGRNAGADADPAGTAALPAAEATTEPVMSPTAEPTVNPTTNPTAEPTAEPIDIAVTDHAPGYASAARFIAASVAEVACDVESLPIHEGYLLDMDGDGVAEIITRSGNCEADAMLSVYACEEGGARLISTAPGSNCRLWAHVDGGMFVQYGHMGVEQVDWVTLEDGALHTTQLIKQHEVEEYTQSTDWISVEPCA